MPSKPIAKISAGHRELPEGVQERRGAQRTNVSLPVRMQVQDAKAAVTGTTVNVSKSGMFIAMRPVPDLGTRLDVELNLPDGRLLLHAMVEVVRRHTEQEPYGAGVRFVDVSYESSELLDEILGQDPAAQP